MIFIISFVIWQYPRLFIDYLNLDLLNMEDLVLGFSLTLNQTLVHLN